MTGTVVFPLRRPRSSFDRLRMQSARARRAWSAGIAAVVLGLTALYSSVVTNSPLNDALAGYPPALRKLFSLDDFTTGPGYLRAELFSFTVPLLLVIPAVLWGSGAIADEESNGTIDLLATAPLSRRRILFDAWASVVTNLAELGAVLALAVVVGAAAFGLDVPIAHLLAAALATTLLAATFGTVSLAVAAATGRSGVARGVAAVAAVIAYLVNSFAELVDGVRPLRWISPWYHALGVDPIGNGFAVGHLALLPVAIGLTLVAADHRYRRRDLGT